MIRQALLAIGLGLAGGLLLAAWASEARPVPECAVPIPAIEVRPTELRA